MADRPTRSNSISPQRCDSNTSQKTLKQSDPGRELRVVFAEARDVPGDGGNSRAFTWAKTGIALPEELSPCLLGSIPFQRR